MKVKKRTGNRSERLGIKDSLIQRTDFIPDSEVKYYLSAANVVIQPYRNATQSGVTPLAYHFEKANDRNQCRQPANPGAA